MSIGKGQVAGWAIALVLAAGTVCGAATDVRVNVYAGGGTELL